MNWRYWFASGSYVGPGWIAVGAIVVLALIAGAVWVLTWPIR